MIESPTALLYNMKLMLQLPLSHLLHPILLIVDFGEPTNELIDAFYTMDICAQ